MSNYIFTAEDIGKEFVDERGNFGVILQVIDCEDFCVKVLYEDGKIDVFTREGKQHGNVGPVFIELLDSEDEDYYDDNDGSECEFSDYLKDFDTSPKLPDELLHISETPVEGAIRLNEGKLRMDLVPVSLIKGVAEVFTEGAKKYDDRNWEKGFNYSVPYASLMRHLSSFWGGEDLDKESNLSHLKHAAANIAMLIEFIEKKPHLDDRPIDKNEPETLNSPQLTEQDLEDMAIEYYGQKTFKYEGSSL